MAVNFPDSIDTLTNPSSTDTLDSPSHSGQHSDINDAVEALETKVGVDSSAVASSLDYKMNTARTGSDTNLVTGTKGTSGDLSQWNSDGDLVDGPTPPSGTIVGISDTQTLTNKTIDSDSNTVKVTGATTTDETGVIVGDGSNVSGIVYPYCKLGKTAVQEISDASATAVTWVEEADVGAMFTSGSSTRITVPSGSFGTKLLIGCTLYWEGNATNRRLIYIYKNGADWYDGGTIIVPGNSGAWRQTTMTFDWDADAGDYYEICAYQDSGGALDVTASSSAWAAFIS